MKPAAWIGAGLGIAVIGGGLVYTAGRFARQEVARVEAKSTKPRLTTIEPADGAVEVSPVTGIKAGVSLPSGAGVDDRTLAAGVKLVRTKDGYELPANRNTSGAGDDVVLVPTQPLELNTQYTVQFTTDLKDTAGVSFDAKSVNFTTAKAFAVSQFPAAFERVDLPATVQDRDAFTALAIGPDGLLYAGTFAGMIHRYTINADGTLTPLPPITKVLEANGGPRLITGIAFEPNAIPSNLVLWVTHGQFAMKDGRPEGAEDWTGKLSRLTVTDPIAGYVGRIPPERKVDSFDRYEDVLVGLPRAYKDHLTFCPAFGPDGAIYLSQGSNTSVGDIDVKWGYRPERKLTAAILRLDLKKLGDRTALNVQTEDGGPYDPAAPDAPLTLYATGVRSGFRLLWHRNGHVYTGVNGAAGNEGNTPASPDGKTPAIRDIKQTTDDLLLKLTPGAYYGQPNPARGQYVLAGGNPTAGPDVQEITGYPVGTRPDPKYTPPTYVFGKNYSPNGLVDYHAANSPAKALDGCILVTRYSDGKDVLVLKLNEAGDVVETIAGLDGFTGLNAPLDLIQDPKSGNLYVAEYRGQRLTLLKPKPNGVSERAQVTKVSTP